MASLLDHFTKLDDLLVRAASFWRPVAFYGQDLSWTKTHPSLRQKLLNLDDPALDRFEGSDSELIDDLAVEASELAELREILQALWAEVQTPNGVVANSSNAGADDGVNAGVATIPVDSDAWQAAWEIPGRKREQIQAFVRSASVHQGAYVEWCSGKGHLGRWLLHQCGDRIRDVTSVELNAALCEDGQRLADRLGYPQRFVCADALSPQSQALLADAHVVALHACGDLHRQLAVAATLHRPKSLAISPCCYHLGRSPQVHSCSGHGRLVVEREQLRLAVTDRVTIHGRELRLRSADMLVRHAYVALRERLGLPYRSFAPMPSAWSALPFDQQLSALCRREAAKSGVDRQTTIDAQAVLMLVDHAGADELQLMLQQGALRWATVRRLDLVRLAFRRALEFWCVLDLALLLERHGYKVQLNLFCDRALTPRNLLLQAWI